MRRVKSVDFKNQDNGVVFLNLKKLLDFYGHDDFAYGDISDDEIEKAVMLDELDNIDIDADWWNCSYTMNSDLRHGHSLRIAKLSKLIVKNGFLGSISIDTMTSHYCTCAIPDGHHRLRALQYLGCDQAPFGFSGYLTVINELIKSSKAADK